MTCGKDGAIVCDGDGTQSVPGVATKPVDTTGAGDIFAGAFLYQISQGLAWDKAAAFANRSASLLVSSFGARLTMDVVSEHLKR